MPLVVKDRVKETTTTTGTGAYTLAGAAAGFQSFSVIGNGNTTYYAVTDGTNWEVGIGTYTSAGTTLSRTTILESSNSGNAVNWGAGTKEIFVTYPAERSLYKNENESITVSELDTAVNIDDTVTTFTGSVAGGGSFFVFGSISGSTLTVTTVLGTGTLVVGAVITGLGISYENLTISAFGTGTGGAGTYTLSSTLASALTSRTFTITYGTLTVTAVASGTLSVGQFLSNKITSAAASQSIPPRTFITALGTGTGGAGTYILNTTFTLTSSTIYTGGSVVTTVDDAEIQRNQGGSTVLRNLPSTQYTDNQGAILSRRLLAANAPRTNYVGFADYDGSGTITSVDGNSATQITASLNVTTGLFRPAYACGVGDLGPYMGTGFIMYGPIPQGSLGVGTTSSLTPSPNGVVTGIMRGFSSPRTLWQSYGGQNLSGNGWVFNTITNVATNNILYGGLTFPNRDTITDVVGGWRPTSSFYLFNISANCVFTLPTDGALIAARVDNGLNTAAGTTLTVTSVTGQAIYIGMELWAEGLPLCRVTAFGTGTGGAGTYTVTFSNSGTYWYESNFYAYRPQGGTFVHLHNRAAFTITSNAANVVPIAGGTAGTALLPATAGSWCIVRYTGTEWEIIAS